MPIYEYQCSHCDEKSEFLQKVSDKPATTCPHCQKDTLNKVVSNTSFQLKGSGWYVTDFRNKKKNTSPPETPSTPEKEKSIPDKNKDNTDKKD